MFDGTANQIEEPEICENCNGTGGFEASHDIEEYDDWQPCPHCQGTGFSEPVDDFKPKRDAWTAAD